MKYNKKLVHELCEYYDIETKKREDRPTFNGKAFDGKFVSGLFHIDLPEPQNTEQDKL